MCLRLQESNAFVELIAKREVLVIGGQHANERAVVGANESDIGVLAVAEGCVAVTGLGDS